MADEAAIVCMKVSELKNPTPGSRVEYCNKCVEEVWFSPSSYKLLADHGYPIYCLSCALAVMHDDGDVSSLDVDHWTDEQRKAQIMPIIENINEELKDMRRGTAYPEGPESTEGS